MDVLALQDLSSVEHSGLVAIAITFAEKLNELVARAVMRQHAQLESLADLDDSSALWEINRRLHRESRGLQATYLLRGYELPESCPEPDREAARLASQAGLALAETLKSYRIGHACTMEAWLEAISETDLTPEERANYLSSISRFVTEYDNRIADFVASEYEREQLRSPELGRTRIKLFRDLLEGRPESAASLGYDLDLHHMGIIATGLGATDAIKALARNLDHQLLLVGVEDGLVMGWLGSHMNGVRPRRLLRDFEPPAGTTLAVGNVRSGYEGLRRTHREASDAHAVSCRRQPHAITLYDDVILEVLALRDEKAAREFIADVLGDLDQDEKGSQRLRATLAAYFRCEQNAAAAAASLGIHAVTVGRHLDQIEGRIGHRVNQRRAELESALRLRSLLMPEPKVNPEPIRPAPQTGVVPAVGLD
jgi:PucR C-terminal helix-turn-helix domain/GGDEF-like domain